MATKITTYTSMGIFGKGKNRVEIELEETNYLFRPELWDIIKSYVGVKGISKTAAIMKEYIYESPFKPKDEDDEDEDEKWIWLDVNRILKPLSRRLCQSGELGCWKEQYDAWETCMVETTIWDIKNEKTRQEGLYNPKRNYVYKMYYSHHKEYLKLKINSLA
jgi:hypothetical protein